MSHTIAHRPETRVHIPMTPIIALVVAVIVAAAVLILVNQPSTTTTTTTTTEAAVDATAAVESTIALQPENQAIRMQLIEQARAGQTAHPVTRAEWRLMRNRPEVTAPGLSSSYELLAPSSAVGSYPLDRATFPGAR